MEYSTTSNNNIDKAFRVGRDSNIELYRIIVMLLIVVHHYVVNSGLLDINGPVFNDLLNIKSIFILFLGAWGKTGINCFVLISGYFMCKSDITLKKFVKLVFEVIFYNVVIYLIFAFSGYEVLSLKNFLNSFIVINSVKKSFTPAFLLFFLAIPFLNIFIKHLDEKQHIRLILLCAFIYVFFGTIPNADISMNYFSWFIVLYFISSYLRFYPKQIYEAKLLWGVMTLVFVLLSLASILVLCYVYPIREVHPYYFVTDVNTFLAVAVSVSSFLFIKNIDLGQNVIINKIASSTFGVLLIHANSDAMRKWLWKDTLDNVGMYGSSFCYIHALISVLCIFLICTIIDMIRIKFIEKPFFVLWERIEPVLIDKYKRIESKVLKL